MMSPLDPHSWSWRSCCPQAATGTPAHTPGARIGLRATMLLLVTVVTEVAAAFIPTQVRGEGAALVPTGW